MQTPPNKHRQTRLLFAQAVARATPNPTVSLGPANLVVRLARIVRGLARAIA